MTHEFSTVVSVTECNKPGRVYAFVCICGADI